MLYLDISCIPLVIKYILKTELVCPSNVLTHVRSDKAHILIVESADDVARHWSTGENFTHQIPFLWPRKIPNDEPLAITHIYGEEKNRIQYRLIQIYHHYLASNFVTSTWSNTCSQFMQGRSVSAMVIPVFEYASIIWGDKNNPVKMDSIQVIRGKVRQPR